MWRHNLVGDTLPILFIILILYGARVQKPLTSLNNGYLSIESGKGYRGIIAIFVVLFHISQVTVNGIIFRYFTLMQWSVAFFYFMSGYGLQKSYIAKGESYKKGFLPKRLPTILIPYIIITIFYLLLYPIVGVTYTLDDVLKKIALGDPVVIYSWYILSILYFYIFYWLMMCLCKKNYLLMIILGAVWCFLYTRFCIFMNYGDYWYKTCPILIVGMFWATYEKQLLSILKRYYILFASLTFLGFILFFFYSWKVLAANIPLISNNIYIFTALFYVLGLIVIALKVQIGNRIWNFLGEISLEIYLLHGIFLLLLRGRLLQVNELLFGIAALTATILSAYPLHLVSKFLLREYKAILANMDKSKEKSAYS